MGGEHRLPRDSRLREESRRRGARIPIALRRVSFKHLSLDAAATSIAGIDVGEDFLDLALIRAGAQAVDYRRVPLVEIGADAIESLKTRLREVWPDAGVRSVALVDSPRCPRDVIWSRRELRIDPGRRALDVALRRLVKLQGIRLSMFPTPPLAYFRAQALAVRCKSHLRTLFDALFPGEDVEDEDAADEGRPTSGGVFTRFMLAGFAVYLALDDLGVRAFEAYPDLQYRLWSEDRIQSKRGGARAAECRRRVNAKLRGELGLSSTGRKLSLDLLDAEVLALSTAIASQRGTLSVLSNAAEGRFLVALDTPQRNKLERETRPERFDCRRIIGHRCDFTRIQSDLF